MSYLLIGLGNPGKKFELTRHNAGKMLARWLKAEGRRPKDDGSRIPERFEIIETDCFMNESGGWVKSRLQIKANRPTGQQAKKGSTFSNLLTFQPVNLIVCHDDLDIPLGSFKIQFGKGPRLHNGVLSVERALRTKEFWRIRIGVDNRPTGQQADRLKNADSGEEYVLDKFKPGEKKVLETVFPEIRDKLDSMSFLRKQESI